MAAAILKSFRHELATNTVQCLVTKTVQTQTQEYRPVIPAAELEAVQTNWNKTTICMVLSTAQYCDMTVVPEAVV